jgi:hypothetical protein
MEHGTWNMDYGIWITIGFPPMGEDARRGI